MKFNYTTTNPWIVALLLLTWTLAVTGLAVAAFAINWRAAVLSGLSFWVASWARFKGRGLFS